MNRLEALVTRVEQKEGITHLIFTFDKTPLYMVGLEPPHGVREGSRVVLGIKPVHIALALLPPKESTLRNIVPVTIESVECGEILSTVWCRHAQTLMEVTVPTASFGKLGITDQQKAWALFLESELSIIEVQR